MNSLLDDNSVNWMILLLLEMKPYNESQEDIVKITVSGSMLEFFDSSYGSTNGSYFTAWTKNRVYFPACYDGSEWVDSVPRNPCDQVTPHVGG